MSKIRFYIHRLGSTALAKRPRSKNRVKSAEAKLDEVVSSSHETIFTVRTVWPFKFFPDTVIIDRTKLTVLHRTAPWSGEVVGLKVEDILNVVSSVGPFFGAIQIHTRYFDPHKPYIVKFLWRHDALKIERIMQGYSVAIKKNIDLSLINTRKLATKLDELGRDAPSTKI